MWPKRPTLLRRTIRWERHINVFFSATHQENRFCIQNFTYFSVNSNKVNISVHIVNELLYISMPKSFSIFIIINYRNNAIFMPIIQQFLVINFENKFYRGNSERAKWEIYLNICRCRKKTAQNVCFVYVTIGTFYDCLLFCGPGSFFLHPLFSSSILYF